MEKTEKNFEEKENNREEATRSVFGDILDDLKRNWWKYLISAVTGAATAVGGAKLLDNRFAEKTEEPFEEEPEPEPTPWEGPAEDISE